MGGRNRCTIAVCIVCGGARSRSAVHLGEEAEKKKGRRTRETLFRMDLIALLSDMPTRPAAWEEERGILLGKRDLLLPPH